MELCSLVRSVVSQQSNIFLFDYIYFCVPLQLNIDTEIMFYPYIMRFKFRGTQVPLN